MQRFVFRIVIAFLAAGCCAGNGHGQTGTVPNVFSKPAVRPSNDASATLVPLDNPATVDQIREYLQLSGDMDAFRLRWIAAVDENRSLGAPYWPEDFWTALKAEMQKTDLVPMYISLFQHGISKELMQEIIDTYHTLGADHFKGSPACFKLGDAYLALEGDMDKLKLAKTTEVSTKVYDEYKPQIKAARAKYMTEHPDWKDQ